MSGVPDSWIATPEPVTVEVMGVSLQVKELTADEYIDLVATATAGERFDGKRYTAELIRRMVVDPALDPAALKPGIRAALVRRLETMLGISPDALKNWMPE
ncbi:MAG: hypothetical protein PHP59_08270 [Methanofollis sp.]|uniref:hypothetical protein n=1 Tax=Methanofollis sp. TaxID=2052835 RepID=UPI0026293E55|nr:hypothetical protein [Methanofollis sp.]MDD4255354.1 hypothetical protein [Methanofollis sp.]